MSHDWHVISLTMSMMQTVLRMNYETSKVKWPLRTSADTVRQNHLVKLGNWRFPDRNVTIEKIVVYKFILKQIGANYQSFPVHLGRFVTSKVECWENLCWFCLHIQHISICAKLFFLLHQCHAFKKFHGLSHMFEKKNLTIQKVFIRWDWPNWNF